MAQYLLSCECGQQHTVDQTQAGESLVCSCGRTLDVPQLRVLRTLPAATSESGATKQSSSWTVWHGAAMLAVIVALIGIGVIFALPRAALPSATKETILLDLDKKQPKDIWLLWAFLQSGIDTAPDPTMQRLIKDKAQIKALRYVAIGGTAAALLAAIGFGAMALKKPTRPRRR